MSNLTWTNEKRKLSDLTPWPRNPRQIDSEQAERLLKSWDKFGQVETLAIGPGNELYDGHQRKKVLSAQLVKYGPDFEVDVRVSSRPLTESEREELTVLKETAAGGWDWGKFDDWDKGDLLEWGFDEGELDAVDWGDDEDELPDPGAQVDKAAELQEKWQTELGQVWEIGAHRLACGDCTDEAVVRAVMGGERAGITATDIPYEVTPKSWDKLPELSTFFSMIDNVSSDNAPFITTSINPLTARLISFFPDRYRHSWIWNKKLAGNFMTAKKRPMMIHEDITVFCAGDLYYKPMMMKGVKRTKGGSGVSRLWEMELTSQVNDEYYPRSIIEIGNTDRTSIVHPTEKPEALYRYLLAMYSCDESIVFDPFLGSGTTMVAAQNLNRRCFGIEIEPKYCAVILERMSGMGLEPKLIRP